MSNNRLCACRCGGVLRNRGRYISGHNEFNGKLWLSKIGKPDTRKMKDSKTVIYDQGDGQQPQDPFELKLPELSQLGMFFGFLALISIVKLCVFIISL